MELNIPVFDVGLPGRGEPPCAWMARGREKGKDWSLAPRALFVFEPYKVRVDQRSVGIDVDHVSNAEIVMKTSGSVHMSKVESCK